jgi:RHS repeat-associated protein
VGQVPGPVYATDPPAQSPSPAPQSDDPVSGDSASSQVNPALPDNPDLNLLQSGGGIVIPYSAEGWKYQQVTHGGLPGFQAPTFNDSSWNTGGAPFGTTHAGCPLGPTVRTLWSVDTDMLLRRNIDLTEPFGPLAVKVTVDNGADVYWNGTLLNPTLDKEGCAAYDDYEWEVPASLQSASNVLAIRAKDRGYASFIDVTVYPLSIGAQPEERWSGGDDPNQTNPTGSESEPVNTLTGAYYTSATDFSLPGRGIGFAFGRDYSSAIASTGVLGPGWVHAYEAHLTFEPDGVVFFHTASGAITPFFEDGGGGFYPAAGVLSKLAPIVGGYRLTRPDLVAYEFDTAGQLTAIVDRNGNQLSLSYTAGQLTQVTDTVGRVIDLTYHPSGRLATVSGPPSRTVSYGYDASDRLTSVTDLRGKVTTYTYDAAGRLESIIDPNSHAVVTNVYGPDGRVVSQTDARGKEGTFAWDPVEEIATFTDARGGEWVDDYDGGLLVAETDPLGNTTTYTYDAAFQLSSVTDARGNTTFLTHDRRGNLLRRQAPAPFNTVETYGWTASNDPAVEVDGRGNITYFGYDGAGNLIELNGPGDYDFAYGHDPAGSGLLVSTTDPRDKTTTYGYDADANRISVTTPLGNLTTYTYDGAGRLLTMVEPRGNAPGADPADYTTAYTYDAADHLLTTTDPLGNVMTQTYDDAGNLLTVTDANAHTTTYAYDEANHLTSVTDAAGEITAYTYDDVGNLASRTGADLHLTTYAYDLAKRMTSTTAPMNRTWSFGYDAVGNLTSRTDANGHTVTYVYDSRNRLSQVLYADAATPNVTYAYDGNSNRTSMSDGAGTETYGYDPLNRLTSAVRSTAAFTFGYDPAGNLTTRQYPGLSQEILTYDDDGRLTSVAGTSYTYDPAGNLLTATTPDGITARYSYDAAGRLLEVAHTTASDTLSRFSYALDPAGNRLAMTTREGTVTYRYDDLDRLTEACWSPTSCPGGAPAMPLPCLECIGGLVSRPAASVTPPPGETYVGYTYDPVGNRLSEASELVTSTYTYDDADRLTAISGGSFPDSASQPPTANSGQWSAGVNGYASDDTYATVAPPKNQTRSHRYAGFDLAAIPVDASIEAVTVSVEWAVSASNAQATLTALAYLGGSPYGSPLVNTSKPTTDLVESFGLTGLTRDDLVNGGFEVEVRASRGNGGPNFTARLDAVRVFVEYTSGSRSFSYDANGNQTSAGGTTYTYDRADRLIAAGLGGLTETYAYAGDGVRLSASTGPAASQITRFLWDRSFALPQLAVERDGNQALLRAYSYGLGRIFQTDPASNSAYYHHDGLGSVADVTDPAGASVAWAEYYPYGLTRLAGTGAGAPPVQPFGFSGEQLDDRTGLYHLRARQYDPGTGRFLTTDPVTSATTDPFVSAYAYVRNVPTRHTDPSGRCLPAAAAGAATGAQVFGGGGIVLGPGGVAVGASGGAAAGAAAGALICVGGAIAAWVVGWATADAVANATESPPKFIPQMDPEIQRKQLELLMMLYAWEQQGAGGRGPDFCKRHPNICRAVLAIPIGSTIAGAFAGLRSLEEELYRRLNKDQ